MKQKISTAAYIILLAAWVWLFMYLYFPLNWLDRAWYLGSTITTIQGSDTLRDSRAVINTNFSNLNTDKFELSAWYATTSAPHLTNVGTLTGLLFTNATGSRATTTLSFYSLVASSTNLFSTVFNLGAGIFGRSTTTAATSTNMYSTFYDGATTTLSGSLSIASSTANQYRKFWVNGAAGSQECTLTDGATVTFDLSQCNQGRVVLGGNRTLDITNELQALGQTIRLVVCSDGSARSITSWDSQILWPAATAPTQTATANKCDVFAGFVTMATGTPKVFLGATLSF